MSKVVEKKQSSQKTNSPLKSPRLSSDSSDSQKRGSMMKIKIVQAVKLRVARMPSTKEEMKLIGQEIITSPSYKQKNIRSIVRETVKQFDLPINRQLESEIFNIQANIRKNRRNMKAHSVIIDEKQDVVTDSILQARELESKLKTNKSGTIEGALVYDKSLQQFNKKQGLIPKQKIGDQIVQNTNADDMFKLFDIHYGRKKLPIKAARQARELYSICRGELRTDPEFAEKYSKQRDSQLSPIFKQPSIQIFKDQNNYIVDTPIDGKRKNFKTRSLSQQINHPQFVTPKQINRALPEIQTGHESALSMRDNINRSSLLPAVNFQFDQRSRSVLSTQTHNTVQQIMNDNELQDQTLKLPTLPHLMSSIFAENQVSEYSVSVPSKSQYKQINGLVDAFYNCEPPQNPKWNQLQKIKQHLHKLSQAQNSKVNQMEDEFLKIRREQNGRGAALPISGIYKPDTDTVKYSKLIAGIFSKINKDQFIQDKRRAYRKAQSSLAVSPPIQLKKPDFEVTEQFNKIASEMLELSKQNSNTYNSSRLLRVQKYI